MAERFLASLEMTDIRANGHLSFRTERSGVSPLRQGAMAERFLASLEMTDVRANGHPSFRTERSGVRNLSSLPYFLTSLPPGFLPLCLCGVYSVTLVWLGTLTLAALFPLLD
jgi:hypothetical protein